MRAQQGLYLSTWKRSNAQGAQLDVSEAQRQKPGRRSLRRRLRPRKMQPLFQ
ncbi:type VI secretion system Vgr family protein [Pseudomonas putida]|nr:type VI secretion system Vgr family protein [Pseudomonas putida]MDD2154594.1 type VI secretion system Vgr family protein [Pseudomonas putida]